MLAFRIFVMLSCLIIVPMAAIFGSAFPDVVKTVLVDRIISWTTGTPLESLSTAAPSGFGAVTPDVEMGQPADSAPGWGQAQAAAAFQGDAATATGQAVVPAAASAPPGDPRAAQPASVYAPETNGAGAPQGAYGVTTAATPPASDPRGAGAQGAPQPLVPGERFTVMERKLREYGATYYLLETWGSAGELYRFHCKMAIGNNPNYTRHFEATDHDALRAMAQVLEKVEMWREGRLQ